MRIFVGITSYNTQAYLQNCVERLMAPPTQAVRGAVRRAMRNRWPRDVDRSGSDVPRAIRPSRIHIVDNGSVDETPELLRAWSSRDDGVITHEVCQENTFAAGGARRAVDRFLADDDCDVFLHLDADTEMRGDAIGSLVRQIGDRSNVVVGVRVDKLMHKHPRSRSLRAFDEYIFGEWKQRHAPDMGDDEFFRRMVIRAADGTEVYRELCGWFLAMPKQLVRQIGNVDDERYGMWRWESEWVLRATARGCDIEHADAVRDGLVHHFGGRSRRREKNPERYDSIVKRDLGA